MNEELQRYEPQEPEQTALVPYHPMPPPTLFGTSDPAEVIAKATAVASALKDVLKRQGLISNIQGKEYPKCEAWTLLGTILGVFPVLQWTKDLENGYEARVEAKTKDGAVVGAAEAICTRAEKNWSNRDDFALKSMAQTRATAKALRMPLGFVMTLAGYQATPAEEMDFEQGKGKQGEISGKSQGKSARGTNVPKPPAPAQASEEQKARWLALLKPLGHAAVVYGWEKGWILGPGVDSQGNDTPGEPLEVMGLEHVPTGKTQAQTILGEIQARMDPQDDGDLGPQKELIEEIVGDEPEPELEDGVETVTGKLEQVSTKEGRSAKGPWKRYGLRVGEEWFNTFDKILGELALKDKGHAVRIQFRRGEKGNDLISIERPAKSD